MTQTADDGTVIEFSIEVTQDRVNRYADLHHRSIASSGGFTTDDGRSGHWRVVR